MIQIPPGTFNSWLASACLLVPPLPTTFLYVHLLSSHRWLLGFFRVPLSTPRVSGSWCSASIVLFPLPDTPIPFFSRGQLLLMWRIFPLALPFRHRKMSQPHLLFRANCNALYCSYLFSHLSPSWTQCCGVAFLSRFSFHLFPLASLRTW